MATSIVALFLTITSCGTNNITRNPNISKTPSNTGSMNTPDSSGTLLPPTQFGVTGASENSTTWENASWSMSNETALSKPPVVESGSSVQQSEVKSQEKITPETLEKLKQKWEKEKWIKLTDAQTNDIKQNPWYVPASTPTVVAWNTSVAWWTTPQKK